MTSSTRLLSSSLALTLVAVLGGCAGETAPAIDDADAQDEDVSGDRRLDPIEVGHAWTYDVKVLGFYPSCSEGIHTATTPSSAYVGGREGKRVQSLCEYAGEFTYAVDGDRVWSWYGGEWILSLDAPVRTGHRWSDGYFDYTWERLGDVSVPAGTFHACWSATKDAPYASYTVFCRGVGPVHWHYEDGFGNGYDAVLVSKSF
jgi:hypothetical protein